LLKQEYLKAVESSMHRGIIHRYRDIFAHLKKWTQTLYYLVKCLKIFKILSYC